MKSCLVDPTSDPRWCQLLNRTKSCLFHSPAWMRSIAQTYDFSMTAQLLLDDDDNPVAGVPFCHISDIRGTRRVTLPFSDYCDPLVDELEQWIALAGATRETTAPYTIRCLHNTIPLQDERFALFNRAKWHGLALDHSLDELWTVLAPSARQAIRKAEKSGVKVHVAEDLAELQAFFAMHLGIRKHKYRMLAQPYAFFEHIWHNFIAAGKGLLLMATYKDEIIGSTMLLEWEHTLYYKFNASVPTEVNVRPNDLLIWHAIKHAKARGLTYLDFGLSDWDQEGLVRYKRKYATDEKTIHFLRWSGEQETSGQTAAIQALLPKLTDIFTDQSVPDTTTSNAGDALYRYFA